MATGTGDKLLLSPMHACSLFVFGSRHHHFFYFTGCFVHREIKAGIAAERDVYIALSDLLIAEVFHMDRVWAAGIHV